MRRRPRLLLDNECNADAYRSVVGLLAGFPIKCSGEINPTSQCILIREADHNSSFPLQQSGFDLCVAASVT